LTPEVKKRLEDEKITPPIPEMTVLLADSAFFVSKQFLAGKTSFVPSPLPVARR
jgi:hypothetical protein